MLLVWKDKRIVTMLSNYNNTGMQSSLRTLQGRNVILVDKPEIVLAYTANMGGVNHTDQYILTCFMRKLLKSWRKLFLGELEICVINSYICRTSKEKKKKKPMAHYKFVKSLINQLRGDFLIIVQFNLLL